MGSPRRRAYRAGETPLSKDAQDAAAVIDILTSALRVVAVAIEVGDTKPIYDFIEASEKLARELDAE